MIDAKDMTSEQLEEEFRTHFKLFDTCWCPRCLVPVALCAGWSCGTEGPWVSKDLIPAEVRERFYAKFQAKQG